VPAAEPHLCLFSLPSAAGAGRLGGAFARTAAGEMGALPLLLLRAVCDVRNPPDAFSGTLGALPPVPLRAVCFTRRELSSEASGALGALPLRHLRADCLTRACKDQVQFVNATTVELHYMSDGWLHVAVER
jgi:hypothetical protein